MSVSKDWVRWISLSILLMLPLGGLAQTRFITDSFEVTVRSGQGTGFSIIRLLRSGTPLELLETDPESGYSKVRLEDGTEGWVITRYLMDVPSGRDRLAKEESRSSALSEQLRATQEQLAQTETGLQQTRQALAEVTGERDRLQSAYNDLRRETADTIGIARNNRELQKRVAGLTHELNALREENSQLADTSAREWFLLGGAVLLVGALFGILVTRIRWKRRRRWEDL